MLSKQLKKFRSINNISQAKLAEALGMTQQAIAKWETDKATPDPDMLKKISAYFNISVDALLDVATPSRPIQGIKIPIIGHVVAGVPVSAVTDIIGYEEITPKMAESGDYFALKVKGESMHPKIDDGDVVIIREQPDVENGEVAIVLVNGDEATVKQVKKVDGGIMLYGFNTSVYEPHFYSDKEIEELPLVVIGKVVESRRCW